MTSKCYKIKGTIKKKKNLNKGIVHTTMKICFEKKEFVSSSDLDKYSITSLDHQWVLCGEWVPSE